jgi:hypothetical protein
MLLIANHRFFCYFAGLSAEKCYEGSPITIHKRCFENGAVGSETHPTTENDPATNDWKPSWSPIGLDQATDEAAIDVGFQMYNLTYGTSNYQTMLNTFRTVLKQNKSRLAHRSKPTIPYFTSYPIGSDGPAFPLRYFDGVYGIGHFGGD